MAGLMAFDFRPLRITGDSGIWWPCLIPACYLLFCPCTLEQVPHLSLPVSFMSFILKLSLFAKEGQFFLYYQGTEAGRVERVLELTGPPCRSEILEPWGHSMPLCHQQEGIGVGSLGKWARLGATARPGRAPARAPQQRSLG